MAKRLVVKVSDELYSDLKNYVVGQHGKIKGELSITVEEMIKDCLDRRKREFDEVGVNERHHEIDEIAPHLIAIHQDRKFVYVNLAGVKMLGAKSADELVGKDVLSFTPPEWRKIHEERIRSIIEDNIRTTSIRTPMLRIDRSMIDVEIIAGMRMYYRDKPAVKVWMKDLSGIKDAEKMSWNYLSYV